MSLVSSAFGGVKFTHPAGKFKGAFFEPNVVKFELKNAVNFTKFKILFTLAFCPRLVKFNEFKAAKFALGRAALPAMFAAFFKFNKILPVTLKPEPKKTATNFMYAAQVLLHQNLAQMVKFESSNLTVNFKILDQALAKFYKFVLTESNLQNLLNFKSAAANLEPQKVKFNV